MAALAMDAEWNDPDDGWFDELDYQTRQVDHVEGRCLGGDEAAVRPHADHAGVDHARHHPRQPACLHAAAVTSRPGRLCHPESRLRHRL